MEVRYCEKLDSGDVWVSPVMMCRDEREARNEMHAGWMPGHARWVETRTGGFLFGRDAAGVAMFAPVAGRRMTGL